MSGNEYEPSQPIPDESDILAAKPCDLDCCGIPPRPTEPHLLKFWEKLVSRPFHKGPKVHELVIVPLRTQPPDNLESILNWSGAVVFPPQPKRRTVAVAQWIVPEVSHPSPPALFTEEDAPKTLVWVGLDGHNGRLPKISCPQIGTFHTPDAKPKDQHYAWICWWHHLSPQQNQTISRIDDLKIC